MLGRTAEPWGRARQWARVGARLALVAAVAAGLSGCAWFRDEEPVAEPYPKLGEVPGRPQPSESEAERRDIAKGLIADREQARYTDQALRGGTEPAAAPPPPPLPGALPALQSANAESTGATPGAKVAEKEERRGFFGRLFGRDKKEEKAAEGPEALPAQPTTPVDVTPSAPPAAPGPQATN